MIAPLKKGIVFLSVLVIFIIHSSFLTISGGKMNGSFLAETTEEARMRSEFLSLTNPFLHGWETHSFYTSKMTIYDSLKLDMAGLSRDAFAYGLKGLDRLILEGRAEKQHILSIIDFSQPSCQKRLYVIDLDSYSLLFHTWVAHGRNSGGEKANAFSNKPSSHKSSLGFYLTGDTYRGKHGYSLRLEGLEKGINDNALRRAIVVHGADYVNESMASRLGYIGRSQGCPAISKALYRPIIDNIKEGSCLFIYYPSEKYLESSPLLN